MTNNRSSRAHSRPSRDNFPHEDSAGNSSQAIAEENAVMAEIRRVFYEEEAQKIPIKNSSSSSNSMSRFKK